MSSKEDKILVILSSPSGVGKTTLTKKIQQKYNNFKISVSHTTRLPRSNEVDGVDYHFVTVEKFKKLIAEDSFYEYAKIYENYYGTLKDNVNKTLEHNDIIFDIDWQGTKQLSNYKKLNLVKIYLITHNKDELKKRLLKRDQNTTVEIEKRFNSFDDDIKHWNDYDYILINKNLEVCFRQIETIIKNCKKKTLISSQKFQ
jgi:guanylate kinase